MMHIREILGCLNDLNVYTPDEWQEYIRFFGLQGIGPGTHGQSNRLLERIASDKGMEPAIVNYQISEKIVPASKCAVLRATGRRPIGVVSGCYDLLHLGHLTGICYAKEVLDQQGRSLLVVLFLSDEQIRIKKGPSRPVLDLNERLEMLCSVSCIDRVIPLEWPDCLNVLSCLRPDLFFKHRGDQAQQIVKDEMELVRRYGGKVEFFPCNRPRIDSTTKLIQLIQKRV